MQWTENKIYGPNDGRSPSWLPQGYVVGSRYVLGRILGQGGFGITYLGWDIHKKRPVAVKEYLPRESAIRKPNHHAVLPTSPSEADNYAFGRKQFLNEAEILSRFNQPTIVRFYDHLEANNTAYLVMQYVEGEVLSELLLKEITLAPSRAIQLMIPILKGLSTLHDAGVYHRDIKPSNVYVSRQGPILIDFGAAKYALGQHSRSLNSVVSPGYSPFEQYSLKGKQGPWTDVYASGATLYKMVTNVLPPVAPDRLMNDELRPADHIAPRIRPELSSVLEEALRVHPQNRIQSVQEFSQRLHDVVRSAEGCDDTLVGAETVLVHVPELKGQKSRDRKSRKRKAVTKKDTRKNGKPWLPRFMVALPIVLFVILLIVLWQSPLSAGFRSGVSLP